MTPATKREGEKVSQDVETMSSSVAKAQNFLAQAAWDVVRCQNAVKEAESALDKFRKNLSEAHARLSELGSQYEKTHESWRLAVIEHHRPFPLSDNKEAR